MSSFRPPEPFNFSKPEIWPAWKQRWDRYFVVSKLGKETGEIQVSTLLYAMGPESETIFPSFDLSDSEQKNHKVILSHFDKHFVPTVNEIHERGKFFLRDQLSDETIEQYIREIYSLAENCNFKTFKEEFIRDRLVLGMRDKVTSKQLQMTPDLSLQKAIEVARAAELIQVQMAAQSNEPTVDAVSASTRRPRSRHEDASSKACCT